MGILPRTGTAPDVATISSCSPDRRCRCSRSVACPGSGVSLRGFRLPDTPHSPLDGWRHHPAAITVSTGRSPLARLTRSMLESPIRLRAHARAGVRRRLSLRHAFRNVAAGHHGIYSSLTCWRRVVTEHLPLPGMGRLLVRPSSGAISPSAGSLAAWRSRSRPARGHGNASATRASGTSNHE
jgi:hypothetical protein